MYTFQHQSSWERSPESTLHYQRQTLSPVPPKMQWKHVYRLKARNKEHLLMRVRTVREATLFTWLLITEDPFDPELRACAASFTIRAGALEPSTVLTLTWFQIKRIKLKIYNEGSTTLTHYRIYEISTNSMQFYKRAISSNYNPTGIAQKSRLKKTTIQQDTS